MKQMGNLNYQQKDWLYQKYVNEKLSAPKIAKLCGIGRTTVYSWMKKYGILSRDFNEAQKGSLAYWWGKSPSKKTREKLSAAITKYRAKNLIPQLYHDKNWLYKKYVIEKLSSVAIAKICNTYEARVWYWIKKFGFSTRNRSDAVKKWHIRNPGYMAKEKNPNWNKPLSEKQKQKISEASKANWKNPEYIKKALRGTEKKPSTPEKIFDEMTGDYIRYVGNRTWWRTLPNGKHKNPDFKITGQDKVIEIFGNYWHCEENPQELIDLYKQIGLDCLVIWEKEIHENPQSVLEKLDNFISI